MSRQQEGRLVFLDAAKGVGILAVMFGHITKLGNPVDIWLSTFKLPVFFIVAGFLICHKGEIAAAPFGKFALKRVKSMLLPYFYFSAVVILYRFFLAVFKGKEMAQVLEVSSADLLDTLSLRGISALWFLPAIFIAEILFFLAMRFCAAGRLLCAAAAFAAYFGTDPLLGLIEGWDARCFEMINRPVIVLAKGMVGALFVACGYLLHGSMQRFSSRTGGLAAGCALFAAGLLLSGMNRGTLDYNNMRFGEDPFLFFCCALASSVGWIAVLESAAEYYAFPILSWCGRNSLVLMATHGTLGFKNIMVNGWAKVVSLSSEVCLKYYLECIGILFHLLVFEYGVAEFVNKKMPFLIGRPVRREKRMSR